MGKSVNFVEKFVYFVEKFVHDLNPLSAHFK